MPIPPRELALVRRFNGSGPVAVADLQKLKDDGADVARKKGVALQILAAVSQNGFEAQAIDWAASRDGFPTKNVTGLLVTQRDGRFSVVWVG